MTALWRVNDTFVRTYLSGSDPLGLFLVGQVVARLVEQIVAIDIGQQLCAGLEVFGQFGLIFRQVQGARHRRLEFSQP